MSQSRVSMMSMMSRANHTRTHARTHANFQKKKSEEVRELLKKDKLPFFEVFVQVPLHIAEVTAYQQASKRLARG